MKRYSMAVALLALLLFTLTACSPAGKGGVAILDLDAVAKAMGRDKVIAEQLQNYAKEQEGRLKQMQSDLQTQVSNASEKIADASSQQDKQSLNAMLVQARSQLTRELGQARQSTQQLRMRLVRDFAIEVQPVAQREAKERGLQIVMLKQPGILVAAAEVDITAEVIERLRLAKGLAN